MLRGLTSVDVERRYLRIGKQQWQGSFLNLGWLGELHGVDSVEQVGVAKISFAFEWVARTDRAPRRS